MLPFRSRDGNAPRKESGPIRLWTTQLLAQLRLIIKTSPVAGACRIRRNPSVPGRLIRRYHWKGFPPQRVGNNRNFNYLIAC
jgi:hypothetical protein